VARRVAVVGAGWAGMAACRADAGRPPGHGVFEAGRTLGGRARGLPCAGHAADGRRRALDNGQHILIGAYTEPCA
jgi:predicted NAD/FAD-binding protein